MEKDSGLRRWLLRSSSRVLFLLMLVLCTLLVLLPGGIIHREEKYGFKLTKEQAAQIAESLIKQSEPLLKQGRTKELQRPVTPRAHDDIGDDTEHEDHQIHKLPQCNSTQENPQNTDRKCPNFKSIYYLKVHKTGSTTAFNMFFRMAIKHSMKITVYKNRPGQGNYASGLVPKFFVGSSKKYNLIADHSVYSKRGIEEVLEKPIVYFTLLRHPSRQLSSFLEYTPLRQEFNIDMNNSVVDYLQKIEKCQQNHTKEGQFYVKDKSYIINWQARCLGFNRSNPAGSRQFIDQFKEVKENFLAGISDYYAESMILFRRKMCLGFTDVVYLYIRKSHAPRPVSDRMNDLVCRHDNMDCLIYDHFNSTLWKDIEAEGPGFREEVDHYSSVLDRVYTFCEVVKKKMLNQPDKIWHVLESIKDVHIEPATKWNGEFTTASYDCALMRVDEIPFSNFLYFLQNEHACEQSHDGYASGCPVEVPWIKQTCEEYCKGGRDKSGLMKTLLSYKLSYQWN